MAEPKKTRLGKIRTFVVTLMASVAAMYAFLLFLILIWGGDVIEEDHLDSPITVGVILVLALFFAWGAVHEPTPEEIARERERAAEAESRAETRREHAARGPRVHDQGCWLCGRPPSYDLVAEYGWYGETVIEGSGHKTTEHQYARIGDMHARLCRTCVMTELAARDTAAKGTARAALVFGGPIFLVGAFLLNLGPLVGAPGLEIGLIHHNAGTLIDTRLTFVGWIVAALTVLSALALLIAFVIGLGAAYRMIRRPTREHLAQRLAEPWLAELAAEQVEADFVFDDTDPHYIFNPNAPAVAYGYQKENGAPVRYERRFRSYSLQTGELVTVRYDVGLRHAGVDSWESKPRQPRRGPLA